MDESKLRTILSEAIRSIVDAVAGRGTCLAIGYQAWTARGSVPMTDHRFFVLIGERNRGAVIGRDGANAQALRGFIRTRATVEGSHDPVDVRVVYERSDAGAGVEWTP